jgi:hypothetical protein
LCLVNLLVSVKPAERVSPNSPHYDDFLPFGKGVVHLDWCNVLRYAPVEVSRPSIVDLVRIVGLPPFRSCHCDAPS